MRAVQQAQKQANITQQESEVKGTSKTSSPVCCSASTLRIGPQHAERVVPLQVLVRSLLRVVRICFVS